MSRAGSLLMGRSIDEVGTVKQKTVATLTQQLKDLVRERDQLKKLNEKMVQKIDDLNALIEQEASAGNYYYNYPPKKDEGLDKKADTEAMKLKRVFDQQMSAERNKFERRFAEMAESFSEQTEELQQLFSSAMKDVIYWKNMFVGLDTKFKEYVNKSERYIKDKDEKLAELQEECQ